MTADLWVPEDGAVAYGGGVQSNAVLVLAALGTLRYRHFLFANVGDDSEDPQTLAYVRHIAVPYAEAHGLQIHELERVRRDKRVETLFGELTRPGSRRLPIPVRMDNGAPGTRSCTADFKIKVIARWVKARGACGPVKATKRRPARPARRVELAMGISLDEIDRLNSRKAMPWERLAYPLVGVLDGERHDFGLGRMMRRDDCQALIVAQPLPGGPAGELAASLRPLVDAMNPATGEPLFAEATRADLKGLGYTRMPRPGKSACWFCPLHTLGAWQAQRIERPATFARACDLEAHLQAQRAGLGKDPVYLTRRAQPLAVAIPDGVSFLPMAGGDSPDDGACDNGWCWT